MSYSDYLENKVQAHVFSGTAYTSPTLYVGLFTSATADDGSGTEVSGGAYARQAMSMSTTGDSSTNSAAVEYPTATASWGTVTHMAIYDAVSGGNMLAHGALTASKIIDSGDVFRFPSGDVDITLS
jgi:hypothetical protein